MQLESAHEDTLRLQFMPNSTRVIGARNYYGREWDMCSAYIAMQGHRFAEAEGDSAAERWDTPGWSETVVWVARTQLAQSCASDAIETSRQAYEGPLYAMGRYQPRSELDYMMALSFNHAGMTDSARINGNHARAARRHADPEITHLLDALRPNGTDGLRHVARRQAND